MPPKRKRNDEPAAEVAAPSTRTTRSSVRTSNAKAASTGKAMSKKSKDEGDNQLSSETAPPAKKTRTTTGKASTKTRKPSTKTAAKSSRALSSTSAEKGGAGKQTKSDDDVIVTKDIVLETKIPAAINESPPSPAKVQSSWPRPPSKEPYSSERARALFKKYEEADEPNTIGADGFVRLCNDAEMAMEGALPLILAWQFGTKEMMKITEEEWRKGTGSLKVSNLPTLNAVVHDLEDLLMLDVPLPPKNPKKDIYDKTAYWKYSQDRKSSFRQLYMFSFALVKPAQSRTINMETATALWSVLLVPKFPLMGEVVNFISDRITTYKAANKDLWGMMLEFCETVNPNLSDYESDGAWPTLLDNFVIWKTGQSTNAL